MSEFAHAHPEVLEYLLKRRSQFAITLSEPGPSEEQVTQILTAAARVPDHGKLAPWRFILYRGEGRAKIGEKLAELQQARGVVLDDETRAKELRRFTRSPLVVGVVSRAASHPKIPLWEQELSVGAACMNLVIAAGASGFGVQWISEWYCFDKEASSYLGCKEGERFAGFVHIGTPTMETTDRRRPELAEIVSEWSEEG